MMNGVQPSEFKKLSWQEYQGLLWNWNDGHDPEGKNEPLEAPDAVAVARSQKRLADKGLARTIH